ncbi:MAG: hypothetical protein JWM33_1224, partial [Caulobacteraceae bacterium]|nr:hypothetical protein [Caulobacteraceae bacterium]
MNSHPYRRALAHAPLVVRTGKVRKILPTYIEADGPHAPRGAICTIQSIPVGEAKPQPITAQVISVSESGVVLAPFDDAATTFCGARVEAGANRDLAPVGDGFCGRVVDALAKPIDGGPPIEPDGYRGLAVEAPMPLARLSVG